MVGPFIPADPKVILFSIGQPISRFFQVQKLNYTRILLSDAFRFVLLTPLPIVELQIPIYLQRSEKIKRYAYPGLLFPIVVPKSSVPLKFSFEQVLRLPLVHYRRPDFLLIPTYIKLFLYSVCHPIPRFRFNTEK